MADCVYTLTRHRWVLPVETGATGCYVPPPGAIGTIDLRRLEDAETPDRPVDGLFCAMHTAARIDDSHHVIARGDLRELRPGAVQRSIWESVTGYRPQGDTLAEWVADHLTTGADPEGSDTCKPLIPTVQRVLEIHLPGHGAVWSRKYQADDPYANRVIDVLQRDFSALWDAADMRRIPADLPLKVLDYWCHKYRVDKRDRQQWQRFLPLHLRQHVSGPVRHNTEISENFDGPNQETVGHQLSWSKHITASGGDVTNNSNQVRFLATSFIEGIVRANSDLSSADHYAQCVIHAKGNGSASGRGAGAVARVSASSATGYRAVLDADSTTVSIFRGNTTALSSAASIAQSLPDTILVRCNGSTIQADYNGVNVLSITDTALSGGTRCGIHGSSGSLPVQCDDFLAADLALGGPFPHHLRRARALSGGMIVMGM